MIRALIVDDEPPARVQVREFLADEPDVTVIGEAGDGRDALEQVRTRAPDLLLMDIRMPQMSGLDVIQTGAGEKFPYTIFITAYANHAVEAFRVDALDYLLKPLERPRFRQAVERARRYLQRDAAVARQIDPAVMQAFLANLDAVGRRTRLPVKIGRATQLLDVDQIEYVEADGDYAVIRGRGGEATRTRESIAALESKLPVTGFVRVHRSAIVNTDCVREVRSNKRGGFSLVMASGGRLTVGAKYDDAVRALIEK